MGAAVRRDAIVRHLVLASFTLFSWRLSARCSSEEARRENGQCTSSSPPPHTPASFLSLPTYCLFPGLIHNVSCLWQSPLTWGQSGERKVKPRTVEGKQSLVGCPHTTLTIALLLSSLPSTLSLSSWRCALTHPTHILPLPPTVPGWQCWGIGGGGQSLPMAAREMRRVPGRDKMRSDIFPSTTETVLGGFSET